MNWIIAGEFRIRDEVIFIIKFVLLSYNLLKLSVLFVIIGVPKTVESPLKIIFNPKY